MSSSGLKASSTVFVDVNIFIDVFQRRAGWSSSLQVINLVRKKRVEGCVSSLTVAITYFLRKNQRQAKKISDSQARADIQDLMQGFDILPLDSDHVLSAFADRRFRDFEDAMQFYSAKGKADVIVTRNKKHYSGVTDEIQILSPEEFLKMH